MMKKISSNLKVFLIAFFISLFFLGVVNILEKNLENFFFWQELGKNPPILTAPTNLELFQDELKKLKPIRNWQVEDLELQAKSAISVLIDSQNNQKVLFQKAADEKLPIASLTKLMTALIILEEPENYDFSRIVIISKEAVAQDEDFGNLKIGDELSIENLFHIMLIESSNDAAYALAEVIGLKDFVKKMNQKAEMLDLLDTTFVNPTGLDSETLNRPSNISTAKDLTRLSQYIFERHPLIFEISSKTLYEVLDSSGQPHHLAINKNKILNEFPNIIGGKTGYTDQASHCFLLVLKGKRPNTYLVNVILGSKNKFEEMKSLVNWVERAYIW